MSKIFVNVLIIIYLLFVVVTLVNTARYLIKRKKNAKTAKTKQGTSSAKSSSKSIKSEPVKPAPTKSSPFLPKDIISDFDKILKHVDNFVKPETANTVEAKKRLHRALWNVARKENVPIFVMGEKDLWAYHKGVQACGMYFHDSKHIRILKENKDDPWVLSHELGHYFLHKRGLREHSEADADNEAERICFSLLNVVDRALLAPYTLAAQRRAGLRST